MADQIVDKNEKSDSNTIKHINQIINDPNALEQLDGKINQKSLKRLIRKAENDPKLCELLTQLKSRMPKTLSTKKNATPREKIRERIKQCRLMRSGQYQQQVCSEKDEKIKEEKAEEKAEEQKKTDEKTMVEIQSTVTQEVNSSLDEIKRQKRAKKNKLKKAHKKHGTISVETYTASLRKIVDHENGVNILPNDDLNHERTVIELYQKQTQQIKEKVIELPIEHPKNDLLDQLIDEELVDLENE
jgi:hypothetical protein